MLPATVWIMMLSMVSCTNSGITGLRARLSGLLPTPDTESTLKISTRGKFENTSSALTPTTPTWDIPTWISLPSQSSSDGPTTPPIADQLSTHTLPVVVSSPQMPTGKTSPQSDLNLVPTPSGEGSSLLGSISNKDGTSGSAPSSTTGTAGDKAGGIASSIASSPRPDTSVATIMSTETQPTIAGSTVGSATTSVASSAPTSSPTSPTSILGSVASGLPMSVPHIPPIVTPTSLPDGTPGSTWCPTPSSVPISPPSRISPSEVIDKLSREAMSEKREHLLTPIASTSTPYWHVDMYFSTPERPLNAQVVPAFLSLSRSTLSQDDSKVTSLKSLVDAITDKQANPTSFEPGHEPSSPIAVVPAHPAESTISTSLPAISLSSVSPIATKVRTEAVMRETTLASQEPSALGAATRKDGTPPQRTETSTHTEDSAVGNGHGLSPAQKGATVGITLGAAGIALAMGFTLFNFAKKRKHRLRHYDNRTSPSSSRSSLDFHCVGLQEDCTGCGVIGTTQDRHCSIIAGSNEMCVRNMI